MKHPTPARLTLALLAGAIVYGVTQTWLFENTVPMPGVEHSGWFLNSSHGVRVISRVFLATGGFAGLFLRGGLLDAAVMVAGAVLAMIIVLFSIGPGTIFPIVLVVGAAVMAGATALGAGAGVVGRFALGAMWKMLQHDG